jgi:hypothetical protein
MKEGCWRSSVPVPEKGGFGLADRMLGSQDAGDCLVVLCDSHCVLPRFHRDGRPDPVRLVSVTPDFDRTRLEVYAHAYFDAPAGPFPPHLQVLCGSVAIPAGETFPFRDAPWSADDVGRAFGLVSGLVRAAAADDLQGRTRKARETALRIEADEPVWYPTREGYEAACATYGITPLSDERVLAREFDWQPETVVACMIHGRRRDFLDYSDRIPATPPRVGGKVGPYAIGFRHSASQALTRIIRSALHAALPERIGIPDTARLAKGTLNEALSAAGLSGLLRDAGLPVLLGDIALVRADGGPFRVLDDPVHWEGAIGLDRAALDEFTSWLTGIDPNWMRRFDSYGAGFLSVRDHGVEADPGSAALCTIVDGWIAPASLRVLSDPGCAHLLKSSERIFRENARTLGLDDAEPVWIGDPKSVLATAAVIASKGGYGSPLVVVDARDIIWSSRGVGHAAMPARPFVRDGGGLPSHPGIAAQVARQAWAWAKGGQPPSEPEYPAPRELIAGHSYRPVTVGQQFVRDNHTYVVEKTRRLTDAEDFSWFADPMAEAVWTYEARLLAPEPSPGPAP